MKIRKGDLFLTGDVAPPLPRIIAHVVNDEGRWGKGFSSALGGRYPWAEKTYLRWHLCGLELGKVLIVPVARRIFVAHICAQRGVFSKSNPVPFQPDVFERCLPSVAEFAFAIDSPVWMPKVGAGLGRGCWEKISPIIERGFDPSIEVSVFEL